MKKVLVTGLSGLIGSALRREIESTVELTALNRRPVEGVRTVQADLSDYEAIASAFEGQDLVIHLAAVIHDGVGWDALLNTNVIGTRNVLEAAVRHGVKKVIFASSGATVAGWERVDPYRSLVNGELPAGTKVPLIDESMPTRPANMYASTKVWGEAIARHYADAFGLEVIALRIGFANKEDRPGNARQYSVWNSRQDVVQAIRLAMEYAPESGFESFFILSENSRSYRDITRARERLGYRPVDSADQYNS